jgi:UDP-N-acetylmuramate dehydrogenase
MLLDAADPNRRSVGSFFVNPVLDQDAAAAVVARAVAGGAAARAEDVPRFPAAEGLVKIPAAWLIEQAGYAKGHYRGTVGISSRHSLALIHNGGGTARDLVELAADIRDAVDYRFGVMLQPEPVFVGFPPGDPLAQAASPSP